MFIFFSLSYLNEMTAQQAPPILWAKAHGARSDWNFGQSVDQTKEGGFIVAGWRERFKSSNNKDSRDVDQIYVVRTDSQGDTLWTREYGGNDQDKAYSVKQTSDGGFIIAGYTGSFSINGNFDVYLIKIDSTGDTTWTRTFGTAENEEGWSVDQTSDGGFIIAGNTTHISSSRNIYLVRTDSTGDTLWTKPYQLGAAYSVKQTKDKGFIVTGYSIDTTSNRNYQLFLICTDSIGDTIWTKTYGDTNSSETGRSILQTSDNGFIITGAKNIGKSYNTYLLRTDSKGDTVWTKIYNPGGISRGYSVDQTADNGFIVTGVARGDVYILRTDPNGDTLWTMTYGTLNSDQRGQSVQQTSDGGFIVAGTGRLESDSSGVNVLLIRLDKEGTAIQNNNSADLIKSKGRIISYKYKKNFLSVNYFIPKSGNIKLELYNTKGKLVKVLVNKFIRSGSHTIKWKLKKGRDRFVAGGMYLLRLSTNGHTVTKNITIVK
jgi:hypothetical protein